MGRLAWKPLLERLVLPPTGPLLVTAAGLALITSVRARRAGLGLSAAGALALWALSTPAVADALLRGVERHPALDLEQPPDAQAIVILGGGVRAAAQSIDGRPTPSATTLARLVHGARVAHATGLPVLVSGTRLEAAVMSAMLQGDLAVTPRWVEGRSRNTRENAQRSAAILSRAGVRRIVLVTSSAHMARSVVEFETAGLAVVPAPTETARRRERGIVAWEPDARALLRSRRVLYEILARCVQSVRGRVGRTARRPPVRMVRPRAVL